jgi:thioesterase domain-containing protein
LVASLFAEIFSLDHVGVNDDFFDLGGDSLVAELFSMHVRERTGRDFKVSSLIENGSPRKIAAILQRGVEALGAVPAVESVRPPIFIVHGRQGLTFPKPEFFQSLAPGQKLHMFELPGLRGGHCYERVEDIAGVYVDQLLQEYPKGPVLLAAFCAGGLIALEMAAQLARTGRPICQLVLLDPPIWRGSLGIGRLDDRSYRTFVERAKGKLEMSLPAFLMRPYLEFRYRRFLSRRIATDSKWARFPLSASARAKLLIAFLYYKPHRYDGPVTILSSRRRTRALRAGFNLQALLPRVRIESATKVHHDIIGPDAAHAMQELFDAALRTQIDQHQPARSEKSIG